MPALRQGMQRLRAVVLTLIAVGIFNVGAAWLSWVQVPLRRCLGWRRDKDERARAGAQAHFVTMRRMIALLRGMRLIDFDPPALPETFDRDRPYVVVANHPSLLDVLFIKASLPGVSCLVKSEVFHTAHVHGMLRDAGDFAGPAGRPEIGSTRVLDLFVGQLEKGRSVLVFPEGTRSPRGGLGRFRRGAAEAAVRTGAPVLPMVIYCDPPLFLKGENWLDTPTHKACIRVEFLPEVATRGRRSRDVSRELEELYHTVLGLKVDAQRPELSCTCSPRASN